MTTITVELTGLTELIDRLDQAPKVIEEEVTTFVNRAAAGGADAAKDLVGKKTHTLERSITAVPGVWAGGTITAAWGTNESYARVHEFGRGPIEAKPGKYLRFTIGGKVFYRKSVKAAAGKFYMKRSRERIEARLTRNAPILRDRIIARIRGGGA